MRVNKLRSACHKCNARACTMGVSVFLQIEGCVATCSLLAVYRNKLNEPCPWLECSIVVVLEQGPSDHYTVCTALQHLLSTVKCASAAICESMWICISDVIIVHTL